MVVRPFDEIFRDFVTDGVPSSGPHHPYKPDIRDSLNAIVRGAFPDNRVIKLNNANEGTANEIVVSASVDIPTAVYQVLYVLNVTQENTGPVTVSGAINRKLVTNTSQPIPAGYLKPGMAVLCIDTGSELRMLSYGDVESSVEDLVRRAEAAEAAAELSKDLAQNAASDAVSQGNVPIYSTLTSIASVEIPAGITAIRVNGRNAAGDGLGGLYIDNDTGSSDALQSADGRTWYRAPDSFNQFGLGILKPAVISGVTADLNDTRPSGTYTVGSALNKPEDATLILEELPFNMAMNTQRRQFAHRHTSFDTYTRYQINTGAFSNWMRILTEDDLTRISDRQFANVLDYGTPTDGTSDCSIGFNAALAGGNKTVYVPAGTYYFNKYVRIQKNTHLIFDPGAIINVDATSFLVNGIVGDANYATGYNGDGNIHIEGGQFNILRTSGAQTAFIQIAHARNILVENCDFKSLWRGHFIEYNAVDDGVIRNCRFTGQQIQAGDSGRAAINLDFSYEVGFPTFGSWDGTKCTNILIEGNFFEGCQTCVDSHAATQPSGRQFGFTIINNVMRNSGQHAIWGRWWAEFMISGNVILSSVDKGILMQDCFEGMMGGNFLKNVATNGDHAIQLQACQAVIVTPNQIRPGTAKYNYAYRCFGGGGNRIDTSGATAGAGGVHSVTDGSEVGRPSLSG